MKHISYGMVNLPSGRMKSREGTVVDADDMIEDVRLLAEKELLKRGKLSKPELQKRSLIIATCPSSDATCSAVTLFVLVALTSTPASSSNLTISLNNFTKPRVSFAISITKIILQFRLFFKLA